MELQFLAKDLKMKPGKLPVTHILAYRFLLSPNGTY